MAVQRTLRNIVRKLVHLDVQRANLFTLPSERLAEQLKQRQLNTVIDVGANYGQFATNLLQAGYHGKIISLEPLPDAWAALKQRAAKFGERWIIGPRIALSDRRGEAKFNIAANSESSSLLKMMSRHEQANPASRYVGSMIVETARLDDVLDELAVVGAAFLKIDTQGSEGLILAGASNSLRDRVFGVQIEMSLEALYDGQTQADELTKVLTAAGFHIWDIIPGFRDPKSFQLLQFDGVFYR
jgi:FkbM family methyltransferase